MPSYHLHIRGQVQGVGFRPFVYRLAQQYNLQGSVSNGTDGVHIFVNAPLEVFSRFREDISRQAPLMARITAVDWQETAAADYPGFSIVESAVHADRNVLISPDFGLCAACREELWDANNRRYQFPFITCTQCGPRLSVIDNIPYDRVYTTMAPFIMCPACREEYETVTDRRYFSQTNACSCCGPQLQLSSGRAEDTADPVGAVVSWLQSGAIVAVKGVGGFLLMCDACNAEAIGRLRTRKNRPRKPLALLYPDMARIEADVQLSEGARAALQHSSFPIVLCPLRMPPASALPIDLIAPGLNQLGLMLPNSPLLDLLVTRFGGPLVATSGNVSGSPICYQDEQAAEQLSSIADYLLSHDRAIALPQDDSVYQFSRRHDQSILLRRSRGLAPTYWHTQGQPYPTALAMGADMKSVLGISHQQNIYLSQYLGDLGSYDSQQQYEHVLQHYLKLTGCRPSVILHDLHPAYVSTRLARTFEASERHAFQHHKAHLAACLFENDLLDSQEPVLGVVWDGVGYGEDGQIWGGEFFRYQAGQFLRAYHFDYFDYLLGDKMSLEPRLAALSVCKQAAWAEEFLRPKFTQQEWQLYNRLLLQPAGLQTSSLGRLFDAAACLLGLGDRNTYEGEAAIYVEQLAQQYVHTHGPDQLDSYVQAQASYYRIPTHSIFQYLLIDLKKGRDKAYVAAKFHQTLVQLVANVAHYTGCTKLAFSGGVFQNGLLVDLLIHQLSTGHQLFFHRQVSPNDENIALGQLALYFKSLHP